MPTDKEEEPSCKKAGLGTPQEEIEGEEGREAVGSISFP